MKTITLQKLELTNFMGIRSLKFFPLGKNAELRGDNGTFKTSTVSGFSWVLFDKDTHGNSTSNFSIKTKAPADDRVPVDDKIALQYRKVIPGIDHVSEVELLVDGKSLKIGKNYHEIWSKKKKVLKSHKTEYFIDEVPVLKKEYDAKIAEIIPEETFRLLTDINYFNSDKFGWQNRRKILFQLREGLSEEALDVAEKAKKILASKKKTINEKKDGIQPRIDEKNRDLAAIADYNKSEIQARITDLDKQIQDIKTDSTRSALLKEQAELEAKLSQIKAGQEKEKQEATGGIRAEIEKIEDDYAKAKKIIHNIEFDINWQTDTLGDAEAKIEDLYSEWDNLITDEPDILDLCPTCQKPFTPEEKESVIAEFNLQQSRKKEEINTAGKKARGRKEKAVSEKIELEVTLKQKQIELVKIDEALDKKRGELENILSPPERPKGDAEKVKIQDCIAEIEKKLTQEDQEQNTTLLEVDLKAEWAKLAEIDAAVKSKTRIIELGEQEKVLSAEIERLEADLFKAEKNIQEQARLLEGPINAKFELVSFSLFEPQLNLGIRPCCKVLVDGIEYGHGLNKGNMINAGLDIIRTLSEYYQIQAPCFIDNCESISYPIDPGCQCFKLIKVKDMEKLEITYE